MRVVISEFMSLDGVVQTPGGPEEDTDGGFAADGGDVQVMGSPTLGQTLILQRSG